MTVCLVHVYLSGVLAFATADSTWHLLLRRHSKFSHQQGRSCFASSGTARDLLLSILFLLGLLNANCYTCCFLINCTQQSAGKPPNRLQQGVVFYQDNVPFRGLIKPHRKSLKWIGRCSHIRHKVQIWQQVISTCSDFWKNRLVESRLRMMMQWCSMSWNFNTVLIKISVLQASHDLLSARKVVLNCRGKYVEK